MTTWNIFGEVIYMLEEQFKKKKTCQAFGGRRLQYVMEGGTLSRWIFCHHWMDEETVQWKMCVQPAFIGPSEWFWHFLSTSNDFRKSELISSVTLATKQSRKDTVSKYFAILPAHYCLARSTQSYAGLPWKGIINSWCCAAATAMTHATGPPGVHHWITQLASLSVSLWPLRPIQICHEADPSKPVIFSCCCGILVCHEWSAGMAWGRVIYRNDWGIWAPYQQSSVPQC